MAKQKNNLSIEARYRRNPSVRETGVRQSYFWGDADALPFEWERFVNEQPFAKMAMEHVCKYVIGHGFEQQATGMFNTDILAPIGHPEYVSLESFMQAVTRQFLMYDGSFALWIRRNSDGEVCAVESFEDIAELRKVPKGYNQYGFVWYKDMRINGRGSNKAYFHSYRGAKITPEEQAEIEASQRNDNGHYYGEVLWHYVPAYGNKHYPIPMGYSASEVYQANGSIGRVILTKAMVGFLPPVVITTPNPGTQNDGKGGSELKAFHNQFSQYNGGDVVANIIHLHGTPGAMPQVDVLNTSDIVKPIVESYEFTARLILQMNGVDPALLGFTTPGQLGNVQQLAIAEGMIIEKARQVRSQILAVVEPIISALAETVGITLDWTVKELRQYRDVPAQEWEVMTAEEKRKAYDLAEIELQTPRTADALNAMSPLVANKVLESMSRDEIRKLIGLEPTAAPPQTTTI